jgi:hypothetical protein
MKYQATVAPIYSIIFVMDMTAGVIPNEMGGKLVAATSSCVAVGTLAEVDGETTITITDEEIPAERGEETFFEGYLDTPSKKISVCTALEEVLIEVDVPSIKIGLKIIANHPSEPDRITIIIHYGETK